MSADPLAVHGPGKADLNVYAYVHGEVLQNVDPLGLQDQHAQAKDLTRIYDGVIKKARALGVPTDVLEAARGKTKLKIGEGDSYNATSNTTELKQVAWDRLQDLVEGKVTANNYSDIAKAVSTLAHESSHWYNEETKSGRDAVSRMADDLFRSGGASFKTDRVVSPRSGEFALARYKIDNVGLNRTKRKALESFADEAIATAVGTRVNRYLGARLARKVLSPGDTAKLARRNASTLNTSQQFEGPWVHGSCCLTLWATNSNSGRRPPCPRRHVSSSVALHPGWIDGRAASCIASWFSTHGRSPVTRV